MVLGAGWPGVLLHEAVGHGLEGDFNRRDICVSGQIPRAGCLRACNCSDDGTMMNRRGPLLSMMKVRQPVQRID
ncbi:hypothetical protein KCP71_09205 [Salmonella enterica subsp. enterica]|nr:hypothetical protein KCP71_09205 [Salmonella enterica subsp. enterica]